MGYPPDSRGQDRTGWDMEKSCKGVFKTGQNTEKKIGSLTSWKGTRREDGADGKMVMVQAVREM